MAKIIDDATTFGIIAFLVLWFLSKFRRETMKETMGWIKDMILPGKEDEQG